MVMMMLKKSIVLMMMVVVVTMLMIEHLCTGCVEQRTSLSGNGKKHWLETILLRFSLLDFSIIEINNFSALQLEIQAPPVNNIINFYTLVLVFVCLCVSIGMFVY